MNRYRAALLVAAAWSAVTALAISVTPAKAADKVRGDARTTAPLSVARLTNTAGVWSNSTALDYAGDRDCFAAELVAGRGYALTADGSGTWNLTVEFRDTSGRVLRTASHPATNGDATSAFAEWTAGYSGRHVLCVTGTPGPDGGTVETVGFGVAGDCPSRADATCNLRLGLRYLWHDAYQDQDGFNLAVAAGTTYELTAFSAASRSFNRVRIVNRATGAILAEGSGRVAWRAPRSGSVLVQFFPGYGQVWCASYKVEVKTL